MTPRKKTKIALDENRMSILGVQMLFGFQLQAPFQTMFDTLPESSQLATVLAFGLLTGAVALLKPGWCCRACRRCSVSS